jgi:hypothetical protein
MNLVGEVLFCVDCVAAQISAPESASAGGSTRLAPRIASKTDANGDALCTPCLDARLARRRAQFARQLGGDAPVIEPQTGQNSELVQSKAATRTWSSTRVARQAGPTNGSSGRSKAGTRGRPASDARAPDESDATQAVNRETQRRFAEVVTELGFARAEQLLRQLRGLSGSITRRA